MEEQRKSMLQAIMTPEAFDRLQRIALVKPDKARRIEEQLIHSARSGKLGGKVCFNLGSCLKTQRNVHQYQGD